MGIFANRFLIVSLSSPLIITLPGGGRNMFSLPSRIFLSYAALLLMKRNRTTAKITKMAPCIAAII